MTPAALEYHVDRRFPVAVVRMGGVLDMSSAGLARAVLTRCLAEQPVAIVVEISRLSVPNPVALSVFSALARTAADWPGAVVLLCAPGAAVAAALHDSSIRHLQVCPTLGEALREASRQPVPPRISEIYLPLRDAPQHARSLVARTCLDWQVPGVISAAQVIVSELVANAVVHARTTVELSLQLRGQGVTIAVRDGSRESVQTSARVSDDAEGGRGLMVVNALASTWGTVRMGDGKVVWATVPSRPMERAHRDLPPGQAPGAGAT